MDEKLKNFFKKVKDNEDYLLNEKEEIERALEGKNKLIIAMKTNPHL